jgi:hypothetical protein
MYIETVEEGEGEGMDCRADAAEDSDVQWRMNPPEVQLYVLLYSM